MYLKHCVAYIEVNISTREDIFFSPSLFQRTVLIARASKPAIITHAKKKKNSKTSCVNPSVHYIAPYNTENNRESFIWCTLSIKYVERLLYPQVSAASNDSYIYLKFISVSMDRMKKIFLHHEIISYFLAIT